MRTGLGLLPSSQRVSFASAWNIFASLLGDSVLRERTNNKESMCHVSDHKLQSEGGSIHRLPNELLVYDFELHKSGATRRWPSLTAVCCFWRELALATPPLWNTVEVYKTTHWLELSLVRSLDTPLQLVFHYLDTTCAAVPKILPHAHRIRVLILPALDVPSPGSYHSVDPDITPFLPLLNTPMPALKTLVAYVKRSIRYDPPDLPQFEIFTTHLPSLRTLRISRVSVPWSTGLLSGLSTLDLRACAISGTSPSPDQFLDVLECCTALEELRLLDLFVSTVFGPHIANIAMSNPDRVIRLPKLQAVKLADIPSATTWLLSHLTFLPGMRITVTGWLPDDLNGHFNSAFVSLIPHHGLLTSLFPTSTPIHGYIRMIPDFAEQSGREEWDVYLQHALRDFCALFSGLPI
ncbi:hypothetical protein VTO73DRAFT_3933 [Trametes versicolor]